jgi:hypothetical protein
VSRSTVHLGDPTSHDPVESDTLTSAPSQKYSLDPVTSSIELPSPVRGQEWRWRWRWHWAEGYRRRGPWTRWRLRW